MIFTAPIVVAIITAVAGVFASALTFFLTKMKEREAVWRTQKLEHYKVFMAALNAIVGPPAPVEDRVPIREDLEIKGPGLPKDFEFRLWSGKPRQ